MKKKTGSLESKIAYGQTSQVFATRKDGDQAIMVGGVTIESRSWTRNLTQRAATQLWYYLTRTLFPEKSLKVTAMAKTAPLVPVEHPTLTNQLEIQLSPDSRTFLIIGRVGHETWWFSVDSHTARSLWAALDIALYPAGWQGPTTTNTKLMN